MKSLNITIDVPDYFEPGCCYECPLSYEEYYYSEDDGGDWDTHCVLHCTYGECPLESSFRDFTEQEQKDYEKSLEKAYKPVKLNIFDGVDTTNINENEYIEAMDKATKLVYEAAKHYIPDPIPNISEMRDASPEEQKGVTDYIMSIAEPTGIKFDEVK